MSNIAKKLSEKISINQQKITEFFTEKFKINSALLYNSVDLRHAGFKIAPVDTNCFPAGFNNLSNKSKNYAKKIADNFLNQNFPTAKKILIIPENHTRNQRYFENLLCLQEILADKKEVIIGSLAVTEKTVFNLENKASITLHPLEKKSDKIFTLEGFAPDVIILNNDLTDAIPEILNDVTIPITPACNMGWHMRTKSNHFEIYNQLATEVSQILDIDPWLISSMHRSCQDVDFKSLVGVKCVARYVDELIENLRKKYEQYGIDDEPYCYVKADSGTYGIAVWAVFSGQEVLEINKKERNKMHMLKGSVENTKVMIQEGIKTIDRINDKIAEPMIYLINAQVVGNLFRVNENRDDKISLNAAGASFFDLENLSSEQLKLGAEKKDITTIYAFISRLAALAAAIENRENKI